MTILEIQTALKKAGFDPGDLDGIWGRQTIAAVRGFQQARGLGVDGIVGPATAAALAGQAGGAGSSSGGQASAGSAGQGSQPGTPLVWFEEALRLVGTKEKPGAGSNPELIHWAQQCNIDYQSDDIPWCGLFVAHCIASTLPDEHLPTSPLLARSWRRFGDPLKTPVKGAVLIFWRGSPNASTGHVGFYRGEDKDAYHVLGGNQSDSVSTCRIAKSRLLEARWPRTAASLKGEKVAAEGKGNLSHNEA
jgi:uncharacterized protein (TIGR02594 family)